MRGPLDRECHFHTAEEIALHPVRARAVELGLTAILEVEGAGVLEEASDDRAHADVFRDARHAWPQGANTANDEVDLHAGARCPIERLDRLLLDERIHLEDHARRPPGTGVLHLAIELGDELLVHAEGRLDEAIEPRRLREARELQEELVHVLTDFVVAREKPVIRVLASGPRVVVAGTEMTVAADAARLPADDHRELRVRLAADHAIHDVRPGLL